MLVTIARKPESKLIYKSQFLDGQTENIHFVFEKQNKTKQAHQMNFGVEVHYRNAYDIKFSE